MSLKTSFLSDETIAEAQFGCYIADIYEDFKVEKKFKHIKLLH
jgi:hypothetical protein